MQKHQTILKTTIYRAINQEEAAQIKSELSFRPHQNGLVSIGQDDEKFYSFNCSSEFKSIPDCQNDSPSRLKQTPSPTGKQKGFGGSQRYTFSQRISPQLDRILAKIANRDRQLKSLSSKKLFEKPKESQGVQTDSHGKFCPNCLQLEETVSQLQLEQVTLTAEMKKKDSKIDFLQKKLAFLEKQFAILKHQQSEEPLELSSMNMNSVELEFLETPCLKTGQMVSEMKSPKKEQRVYEFGQVEFQTQKKEEESSHKSQVLQKSPSVFNYGSSLRGEQGSNQLDESCESNMTVVINRLMRQAEIIEEMIGARTARVSKALFQKQLN